MSYVKHYSQINLGSSHRQLPPNPDSCSYKELVQFMSFKNLPSENNFYIMHAFPKYLPEVQNNLDDGHSRKYYNAHLQAVLHDLKMWAFQGPVIPSPAHLTATAEVSAPKDLPICSRIKDS